MLKQGAQRDAKSIRDAIITTGWSVLFMTLTHLEVVLPASECGGGGGV